MYDFHHITSNERSAKLCGVCSMTWRNSNNGLAMACIIMAYGVYICNKQTYIILKWHVMCHVICVCEALDGGEEGFGFGQKKQGGGGGGSLMAIGLLPSSLFKHINVIPIN